MNPDLLHIRGRWMTMTTATRCVHHTSLADACDACGLTGRLEDFTDAQLMAECDRRRLNMAEVEPESKPISPERRAELMANGSAATRQMLQLTDDFKEAFGDQSVALPVAESLTKPTPPERPAKKGRK